MPAHDTIDMDSVIYRGMEGDRIDADIIASIESGRLCQLVERLVQLPPGMRYSSHEHISD